MKKLLYLVAAIIIFICSDQFAAEKLKLEETFSYHAELVSSNSFYNDETRKFNPSQASNTIFSIFTEGHDANSLSLQSHFKTWTGFGENLLDLTRKYEVDRSSGKLISRKGFLFAPGNENRETFLYWHTPYNTPLKMKFAGEEKLGELETFRFESVFSIDSLSTFQHLLDLPEIKKLTSEVKLILWVEPQSGYLVKFEDHGTVYRKSAIGNTNLTPWTEYSHSYTQPSLDFHVKQGLHERNISIIFKLIIPILSYSLAAFLVILGLFPNRKCEVLSLLTTTIGLVGLVGWLAGVPTLIQLNRSFPPMVFNTALCFVLLGLSTLLATRKFSSASRLLAFGVLLLSGATLIQYLFQIDLTVDELFISQYLDVRTSHPGRMSPNTALCFLLSALSLFTVTSNKRTLIYLTPFISMLTAVASISSILGYLLEVEQVYVWSNFTGMAFRTALGFVFAGSNLIFLPLKLAKERNESIRYSGAIFIFIVGLLISIWLWSAILEHERRNTADLFKIESRSTTTLLRTEITRELQALNRMAERWIISKQTRREEWENDAKYYVKDLVGIVAVEWVDPKQVVQWVIPLKGNEVAVLYDNKKNVKRSSALIQARDENTPLITPSIDLIQGGKGFLAFFPLWKGKVFNGYIVGVFRFEDLFNSILTRMPDNTVAELLEGDKAIYTIKKGSGTSINKKARMSIPLNFGHSSWEARLYPLDSYFDERDTFFPTTILLLSFIVTILFSVVMFLYELSKQRSKTFFEQLQVSEESEKRFQAVIEAAPSGMLVIDNDNLIILANSKVEQLFHLNRATLLGTQISLLVADKSLTLFNSLIETKRKGNEFNYTEADGTIWCKASSNVEFPVSLGLNTIKKQGLDFLLLSIVDISNDLKQAEHLRQNRLATLNLLQDVQTKGEIAIAATEELKRSNDELDRFAYIASHDLKAPLRAIGNYAEWVVEDCGDLLPSTSKEHLEKLQIRIEKMRQLLDDLLDYSRVGRTNEDIVTLETNKLIEDVIELVSPPKGFDILVKTEAIAFKSPKAPLELVLRNLISNAIEHHNRSDGRITISVSRDNDELQFEVQDDGPGIDQQYHTKIFEMFQSLSKPSSSQSTGMGLAFVKKTIEVQGGSISVESTVGKGSTFKFSWPVD